MDILLVSLAAMIASSVSLVSGFGLGTVLLPAFALMMPLPTAIAAAALVHLLQSGFKLLATGRAAQWGIVVRFGLPAVAGSLAGASALVVLGTGPELAVPWGADVLMTVKPLNVAVGLILIAFALGDRPIARTGQSLPVAVGGLFSGFLGGVSGIQGALRSAVLSRVGLDKTAFIATGAVTAALVDTSRVLVYGLSAADALAGAPPALLASAIIAAALGVAVGTRVVGKMTDQAVHTVTRGLLVVFGGLLCVGVL
ncbi:TSUP family transporter [Pararhodospirillum photometricum]|uniref:Probable membrane transporter protein n=1 Tax=Pararhodospirillum photometricum DSM 122 TaxID=1150469 RepID=H6SK58_PARPM|nr:TSUP family transporter [Pararhodospirillum photometricum]CCG08373.1 Putative uncharacterized protein [Pararhodospirillum photometricum DSM 122]